MKEQQASPVNRGHILGVRPGIALSLLLSIVLISSGDLMEVIPLFAPVVASPVFPFFHEIHDLMAAGLVIYATYKYRGGRLGMAAILVYVSVHIPYFIIEFPENTPGILFFIFVCLGAIFGIWLISRLYKSEEQMKASQEILRGSEEDSRRLVKEWEETFNAITDLVSIHAKDHRIIKANKAFLTAFNKTPDEVIGKYCYELVHGSNKPAAYCPHDRTLDKKTASFSEEFEPFLGKWLQISTAPVFDKEGQVVATVHITRDITVQKKLQATLIEQDKLSSIGRLIAGVAHEINNPLTSIIGFSQLLLEKVLPGDVNDDLKIINDEANRTANIVKGLLTFARKQPEKKEPTDVNTQVQRVLELNKRRFVSNNIQVNTNFAEGLPYIIGNGPQLQQVLFNLVMNAEQIMLETHGKGTLTIATKQLGDMVKIFVTDDGPGISPENMQKLFTPFFTTKEVGKGTGLGLSICHGIIAEHGGNIYAESEPGKGATFIVELPVGTAT